MEPIFFAKPSEFRAWLEKHHGTAREVWVGYYKKRTGRPSITWSEAVDEAICFGWIDGAGKRIDDVSHIQRFTPRKPRSTWSLVNINRAKRLIRLGRMRPAGRKAFEQRLEAKSGTYSYEQQAPVRFDAASERQFHANKRAWAFFQTRAASYGRAATWWVISAKKEETRRRRLATLIEDSAEGRTIRPLTRPAKRG